MDSLSGEFILVSLSLKVITWWWNFYPCGCSHCGEPSFRVLLVVPSSSRCLTWILCNLLVSNLMFLKCLLIKLFWVFELIVPSVKRDLEGEFKAVLRRKIASPLKCSKVNRKLLNFGSKAHWSENLWTGLNNWVPIDFSLKICS